MILPEGFDENLPKAQQVEQLVNSGLYTRGEAEMIVDVLGLETGLLIE